MDVCLHGLEESNKSRLNSYSVRNSVLIISHITIRDCRVHSFSDNLSRINCILIAHIPWWLWYVAIIFIWNVGNPVITSAEREVKDSRRSRTYQSCHFLTSKVCRFSVLFGYLTKWEPNYFEISRDYFDFFDLFFTFFEEERIIILAFNPGFEPTHLCDPSDQRRLSVEGLADCATATQGTLTYEK